MSRRQLAVALTVVLSAVMVPSVHAQDRGPEEYFPSGPILIPAQPPERQIPMGSPQPIGSPYGVQQSVSYHRTQDSVTGPGPTPIDADQSAATGAVPVQQPGYVRLGAPMYPTPRPNIPIWSGSTVITNQAFAPHEMLYPHTYRAIYPPYYHRVKGGWILTPCGVRSHERWELQGTQVQVKYRSNYPGCLSGSKWCPPATSYDHGAWR